MIEVQIESVRISLMSPNQVVILKEITGNRRLPVFIGKPEGDAITFKLNQVASPRPLTHELTASLIEGLGVPIERVLVRELRDDHFFASIFLRGEGGEVEIDARASDALAVAVHVSCPIFVADDVMSSAGVIPPSDESNTDDLGAFDDFIRSLDLDDLSDTGPNND
jgi:hypothetical protein